MPVNKNEITKEMLEKAMQCKTAEELIAYAKTEGVDLTLRKRKPRRTLMSYQNVN